MVVAVNNYFKISFESHRPATNDCLSITYWSRRSIATQQLIIVELRIHCCSVLNNSNGWKFCINQTARTHSHRRQRMSALQMCVNSSAKELTSGLTLPQGFPDFSLKAAPPISGKKQA
jgi:hypothetical protein